MALYTRIPSDITTKRTFANGLRIGRHNSYYVLPAEDGTPDDALITDGNGVLTWRNPGTNADFITSGTLADARLTSNVPLKNTNNIMSEPMSLTKGTASSSTTTGTLIVTGGIGVSGSVYGGGFFGPLTGNASTATTLETSRTIALSTDATGSVSFNGSSNVTIPLILANTGVDAGTWTKVTVDLKGRVTSATNATTSDIAEGTNLYYTQARFDTAFSNKTTTNLAEGTNLYFTTQRARDSISAGTGVSISNGQISIGQGVATTNNVTFRDVTVSGTLTLNGTSAVINSTISTLKDPILDIGGDTGGAALSSNDGKDRGILFQYYDDTTNSAKKGFFGYDNSKKVLTFIPNATNVGEVISGTAGTFRSRNLQFEIIDGDDSKSITVTPPEGLTQNSTLTLPSSSGTLLRREDSFYLGTTEVPLNRANTAMGISGITSVDMPSGSYTTTVRGSPSSQANWSMTLPVTTGTNGQLLVTDGTGVTSWSSSPAALLATENTWTANQNFNFVTMVGQTNTPPPPQDNQTKFYMKDDGLLYYRAGSGGAESVFTGGVGGFFGGYVGSGDGYLVTANGLSISLGGSGFVPTPMGAAVAIGGAVTYLTLNYLRAEPGIGTNWPGRMLTITGGEGTGTARGGDIVLKTTRAGIASSAQANAYTEVMRITHDSNVGIGKSVPIYKLDVNGTIASPTNLLYAISMPSSPGANKGIVYTRTGNDNITNLYYMADDTRGEVSITSSMPQFWYGDEGIVLGTALGGGIGGVAVTSENTWVAQQNFSAGLSSYVPMVFIDYSDSHPDAPPSGRTQIYSYRGAIYYRGATGGATLIGGGAGAATGVANEFSQLQTFLYGINVTGNTTIAGTLTGLTGLTVGTSGVTVQSGGINSTGYTTFLSQNANVSQTQTANIINAFDTSSAGITVGAIKTGLAINSTGTWTKSGQTGTNNPMNRALYVNATGAANGYNYAAIFENGYVGIGTTTPQYALDVIGTGQFVTPTGGTTGGVIIRDAIGNPGYATLEFKNNAGTSTYTYLSAKNGAIGIGKTNPSAALDVVGAGAFSGALSAGGTLTVSEGGATITAGGITVTNGGSSFGSSGTRSLAYEAHAFTANNTSTTPSIIKTGVSIQSNGSWAGVNRGLFVSVSGGGSNYAAIFNGGNVGVNTNDPSVALDVLGNISARLASSADAVVLSGRNGGTNSYKVTIIPDELGQDQTLTLPNVTGTVVTTGDVETVTNLMLAGSIENIKLTNSSLTINGTTISLGSSGSINTDAISEGSTNQYFTTARARASFSAGAGIYITAGQISVGQPLGLSDTPLFAGIKLTKGIILPVDEFTTNTTLTASHTHVFANGTITITLPTAVGILGRTYWIKNVGTGTITIATTDSQTIDGQSTQSIEYQWDSYTVVSNGANWFIV